MRYQCTLGIACFLTFAEPPGLLAEAQTGGQEGSHGASRVRLMPEPGTDPTVCSATGGALAGAVKERPRRRPGEPADTSYSPIHANLVDFLKERSPFLNQKLCKGFEKSQDLNRCRRKIVKLEKR